MEGICYPLEKKSRLVSGSPIRIIIVDDRSPAREGLKALISVLGKSYNESDCPNIEVVGEACDGTQAIKVVEEQHPDLVIMDIRMPGLSGLDATRLIKTNWPDIHIILISFYSVHRIEAVNAGADSFLLKGCNPEELLRAILNVGQSALEGIFAEKKSRPIMVVGKEGD